MNTDPIVIVGVARTPMGAFQGDLKSFTASQLGAAAIRAAVERAQIKLEEVDEVIMGCVLPAGQGQAPARQASLSAGLPLAVGCTTVNKMCGSGMKAAMFAHDLLVSGSVNVIVAGGMESMTNAPYLLPKARAGLRMGHAKCSTTCSTTVSKTPMKKGGSWAPLPRTALRSINSQDRRRMNSQSRR